ncbi:MAG: hypothetical protein IJ666_07130 [Ruminococcus sp.]|nr:hypothetical protein [Ruminococcus sp.]
MKLTEKMSYLQGLIDGLEIDKSTKEGKALIQMSDVLAELVVYVEDLQSQVDELTELCDILDKDLGAVEEDLYEDDGFVCGDCRECPEEDEEFSDDYDEEDDEDYDLEDDDEELYEVTCPSCGDTIFIDEEMIDEGSINCPNCNEFLEFDVDSLTIEDFENEDNSDETDE